MPTVQEGTHRGNVCEVLSKNGWMDCYDVAEELGWSENGASKVLGDIFRADYVHRRPAEKRESVDYEYQLKSNVRVG